MDFLFTTREPGPELKDYVQQIFYARGRITYKYDKILPNGKVVLVINLGDPHKMGKDPEVENNPKCTLGWFSGTQITPVYNYPLNGTHVLGCLFDPLGFYRMFAINMSLWADRSATIEEVFNENEISGLRKTLVEKDDEQLKLTVFEQWLNSKLGTPITAPSWLQKGYQTIQAMEGNITLEEMYQGLNLSGRHFNNVFRKMIGLSPKVYCRVLRLNALLSEIDPNGEESLIELSHRYHFTDQSHFNREFKKFSGLTPRQYLRQRRAEYGELEKGQDAIFIPQR